MQTPLPLKTAWGMILDEGKLPLGGRFQANHCLLDLVVSRST